MLLWTGESDLAPRQSFHIDDIFLVTGTSSTPTPPPSPTVPSWRQVWGDEFNGTSVDPAKWNVRHDDYASYELSCVTNRPSNVFVANGVLTLRARKEAYACGSTNRSYTSGYLDTRNTGSWTYGRFEMRAKLPTQKDTSKGLWPAFWLRPNDGGVGELDVMEAVGSAVGEKEWNRVSTTIHYDYVGTYPQQGYSYAMPAGTSMDDGFHIYAMEWEPGVLRWYVDGKEVFRRYRTTTPWFDKAFSRPFHYPTCRSAEAGRVRRIPWPHSRPTSRSTTCGRTQGR